MGEGTIFDRWEAAGRRAMEKDEARRARWAAIERAARWPLLACSVVVGLALEVLADWPWWPWAIGGGALVLLALVGVRRRLGVAYTATVALLVVDAGLLTYVTPWLWLLLAGIGGLGFAVVAALRLGWWQRRRAHVVAVAAAGLALVVTSMVGLAIHAAEVAATERQQLAQAHEEAFSRIMPHSSGSFVQSMIKSIAERQPNVACAILTASAGRDFAAAYGADSCERAIEALSEQVPNGIAYQNAAILPLSGGATEYGPHGRWLVVNACALSIDPPTTGPTSLGIFQLELASGGGGGYQATRFTRCP